MIRLGLVQAPATDRWQENLQTLTDFSRQARDSGCSCVCFPEAFLTGYEPDRCAALSLPFSGQVLQQVCQLAATLQIDILTGFMEADNGVFYITHGLFRRDGTVFRYRKTHLGQREQLFFHAGDTLPVFPLSCGLNVGIQLCVENHFPDITRTLSMKGAQVIFAPHAVPAKAGDRRTIWSKFIPARSYDNRVYMACCNQYDGSRFAGGLLVTDQRGNITASCFENRAALVTFEVDEADSEIFRHSTDPKLRYYPALRRPELYD